MVGLPSECAGLTGSSTPPLAGMPCASTPRVPTVPPQSLELAHRASPSFCRVATRRVPQCIDRFGPADSHPPPPHVQGATLLTRPRGDAVGFALRVAVAFAGRGLSPPLRFSRVRVLSSSSTLLGLLRHSAICELTLSVTARHTENPLSRDGTTGRMVMCQQSPQAVNRSRAAPV